MKVGILGTGKFALSIGCLLEKNNIPITFIGRDFLQLNELERYKQNSKYSLYKFTNYITVQHLSLINFSEYDYIFFCIPSRYINLVKYIDSKIIFTSKGFSENFIFENFTNYCILSGGSYASEIIEGIPCYITLSSIDFLISNEVAILLESDYCHISFHQNPRDIEIYGIYKNILAIFCGIIQELKMGKNISSAFITKMLRYINKEYNMNPYSLLEPAGIGDIILTCTSEQSRNFNFGIEIVKNKNFKPFQLVEGLESLENLYQNKKNHLIEKLYYILQLCYNNQLVDVKNNIYLLIY
jgi:glycerol-3-phosphate dehydrogenase (NAD(P)+)